MISITVNITDNASQAIRNVINSLTGPQLADLNEQGGRAAVVAAIEYHRDFDKGGGWRGPRYLGTSKNDGSSFGADVARGWHFLTASNKEAIIANNADHYAFKVKGGTITPKRAKALTIPLIAEARGLSASVYQQNTGHRLFRPKGRFVLMEKTEDGKARSVYALVKSVTQGPWPNAVPDDDVIASAFLARFRIGLSEIIENS